MVFDCSFDLAQPDAGVEQYRAGPHPGRGVRQPRHRPERQARPARQGRQRRRLRRRPTCRPRAAAIRCPAARSSRPGSPASASPTTCRRWCTTATAPCICGRLWWMLKWMGHDAVAVLDGGLAAWQAAGFEVTGREEPAHFQSNFVPGPALRHAGHHADVAQPARRSRPDPGRRPRRAALPRRNGTAGPGRRSHPGCAATAPTPRTSAPDGRFKPAAQLRAEFESLLAGRDPSTAVHHCGSGVSAVPNLLAMQVAGLGTTALYAGSWSEWSNTPGLPTRQGADA